MRYIATFNRATRELDVTAHAHTPTVVMHLTVPPELGLLDLLTDEGWRPVAGVGGRDWFDDATWTAVVEPIAETIADALVAPDALDSLAVLIRPTDLVQLLVDFAQVADRRAPADELEDCARSIAMARGFIIGTPLTLVASA